MQTGHEGLSLSQRATHAAWKVCAHAGRMLSSSPAMHGVRLGCRLAALALAGWKHSAKHAHRHTLTLSLSTEPGLTLRILLLAHDAQRVLPLEGILLTQEGAPGQGQGQGLGKG